MSPAISHRTPYEEAGLVPTHQKAIVADELGSLVVKSDVQLPRLEADMLLVRTATVALNPVDVKLTGAMAAPGATSGSDCAGVVVAMGSAVSAESRFAIGNRICAPVTSMNPLAPRDGAFAD